MDVTKRSATREAELTLHRIADALGMSPHLFYQAVECPRLDAEQASILLWAFARIRDPRARERCLAYVEDAALVDTDAIPLTRSDEH